MSRWDAEDPRGRPAPPTFGLFVGIDRYEHLSPLRGCANDANLLSEAFRPISETSIVLLNENATRQATLSALEGLMSSATAWVEKDNDGRTPLIVVTVGAHGLERFRSTFVLPTNATNRILSTGFPFGLVARSLASLGIPSLIIADICHAGTLALDTMDTVRKSRQGIIMSSGPGELSEEEKGEDGDWHGVFSHSLATALRRAIGRDEEINTLHEAFNVAYRRTKTLTDGRQHPVFFGTLEPDLWLGKGR